MMIRARLIELAVSIGYPSLQRMMHTVNAYAHATDEQLTDMQLQKLNVLLAHHMSRDPYRRYCEQAGVGRSCIRSLEDLREFPIVTKSFLRTT
jgi:phenylacetate-coenzyme A ligase PaaK-like adenylate-forming protein